MPQSWPGGQPKVWTFIDFEAPDDMAEELAHAIPDVLKPDFGWWADFRIGDNEHVIIYADRVIRSEPDAHVYIDPGFVSLRLSQRTTFSS